MIEYLCAVYESPKIYLEINNLIKRAPKNIHVNLLLVTNTDTNTPKIDKRIRIQKN